MDSLAIFLDQGFPVAYGLDTFNTPHTGTTLRHPKIGYVDCDAESAPTPSAYFTSGQHFLETRTLLPKTTRATKSRSTFISSNSKHDFCYTMAKISPSHVQRHALLSQLYHNFKSFTYFFRSYETCSININSLFHAAIKNLHVKANGIFVFLLLHPPLSTTTISEE